MASTAANDGGPPIKEEQPLYDYVPSDVPSSIPSDAPSAMPSSSGGPTAEGTTNMRIPTHDDLPNPVLLQTDGSSTNTSTGSQRVASTRVWWLLAWLFAMVGQ